MLSIDIPVREFPFGLGPFDTSQERYMAFIDLTLRQILDEQRFTLDPLTPYLWHMEMKELVNKSPGLAKKEVEFYLKHGDDKGDHFLVDDEGHLSAVIDWEW